MIGWSSALRCAAPKFLHCGHSRITWTIVSSSFGLYMRSVSANFMASRPQCLPLLCSSAASTRASVRGTHSTCVRALVPPLRRSRHRCSFSTKYSVARCCAQRWTFSSARRSMSCNASITSRNIGSSAKRCRSVAIVSDTRKMLFTRPPVASQSSQTD